ncbi:hypothetical protein [Janthinobacterium sp. B9-8]|uniref:hypothetical protein n=1 Tax=Janthinobacterium sp. B9-8 TaxID=1236179 RepID=UPI0012E3705A|nr:hypothetical protein [Janthinobacterium sp. B9-8]
MLITALAWLYKARIGLNADEIQQAYQSIMSTVFVQYGKTDDHLLASLPWRECSDADWSQHLLQFALQLRSNYPYSHSGRGVICTLVCQ